MEPKLGFRLLNLGLGCLNTFVDLGLRGLGIMGQEAFQLLTPAQMTSNMSPTGEADPQWQTSPIIGQEKERQLMGLSTDF